MKKRGSSVEAWGSVGVSQHPLFQWELPIDSASENQSRSFRGEQRTGCPFSGDREQLGVTALLCVCLSGCAWYSHDFEYV